ncbi:hypothetical protein ACFQY0_07285 [Haloferula chungangensis]|uniref:Uncharacterized protein n=1 Tax=Haloferula chungangensis TaxID=1048331 RepID=A0ABW2L3P0_9BACT
MNRRVRLLLTLLLLCLGFAMWQWMRPYDWNPDPQARAKVSFVSIERDESFYWLDIHLKITDPRGHDLEKPVRLVLADGRELEPADTKLEGSALQSIEGVSFRFWLDSENVMGPLRLKLNDGTLLIRQKPEPPQLAPDDVQFHQSNNW